MTKRERKQIHKAMSLMWEHDDALGALVILKKLVGMDTSVEERLMGAKSVDLFEILKRPAVEVILKEDDQTGSAGDS